MAKAEVGLHMYSGHPKDTRYDEGNVERYTADAWCTRLEMVASSAGWNSRAQAANAALALAPGSPADIWFQVVKDDNAVKEWTGFKRKFLKEFMPEESVMEKISLLNSMTQERKERVSDFKNKLTNFFVDRTFLTNVLCACDLRGFTKEACHTLRDEFVVHVANSWARTQTRSRI